MKTNRRMSTEQLITNKTKNKGCYCNLHGFKLHVAPALGLALGDALILPGTLVGV